MIKKGRLAQLVERYIDVVDVRGSNPLPPTRLTSFARGKPQSILHALSSSALFLVLKVEWALSERSESNGQPALDKYDKLFKHPAH